MSTFMWIFCRRKWGDKTVCLLLSSSEIVKILMHLLLWKALNSMDVGPLHCLIFGLQITSYYWDIIRFFFFSVFSKFARGDSMWNHGEKKPIIFFWKCWPKKLKVFDILVIKTFCQRFLLLIFATFWVF